MSRHWNQMSQASFIDLTHNVSEIAREVAMKNARFAKRFAGVDWTAVFKFVVEKALRRTADELDLSLSATYNNTTQYHTESGQPLKGACLGVIHAKRNGDQLIQLGVAEYNGTFSLFHNVYSEEHGERDLSAWKKKLEQALKEETLAAAVAVVTGSQPIRMELPHGVVVFEALVKGVG